MLNFTAYIKEGDGKNPLGLREESVEGYLVGLEFDPDHRRWYLRACPVANVIVPVCYAAC